MLMTQILTLFTAMILTTNAAITPGAQARMLPEGKWKLTDYNFRQKMAFPIDRSDITLNINGERLGGVSGCNVYGGSYTIEDGKLKIGDLISTMMACDPVKMQFERHYSEMLRSATIFTVENDQLTILDPVTKTFLRFEQVAGNDQDASTKPVD